MGSPCTEDLSSELHGARERIAELESELATLRDRSFYGDQLHLLAEHLTDIIWVSDLDLNLCYCSPAGERMLGFSLDKVVGRSMSRFVSAEDFARGQDLVRETLGRHARGELQPDQAWSLELQHRRNDGDTFWAEIHARLQFDEHGQPLHIIGTTRDITARKTAETELKQSKERLNQALKATAMGLWELALDTDKGYFSPECYAMLDIDPASLPDCYATWADLCHPDDIQQVRKRVIEYVHDPDRLYEVRFRMRARDGQWHWMLSRGGLAPDSEQTGVRNMLGILTDITHQVEAEEALKHDEQRYRLLTENAGDLIWSTNTDLRCTYASPAITPMSGYTVEETLGRPISDFIDPDALSRVQAFIRSALEGYTRGTLNPDQSRTVEVEMLRKDGSSFRTEVHARILVNTKGSPVGLVGISRDITSRWKAGEAVRRGKERLELALKGADLGLWEMDVAHGAILYDSRCAEMLEYTDEMPPLTRDEWSELIHPEDRAHVRTIMDEHLCGRTSFYEAEYRVRTRSGTELWISDRGMITVRDQRGRPLRMTGTHGDIDAAKRARLQLAENEKLYRTIFETTSSGMVIFEEDLTINFVNAEFARIVGRTKAEIEGRMKVPELVADADRERLLQYHEQRILDPDRVPLSYEISLAHRSGQFRDVLLTVALIPDTRQRVTSIADLTDRKRLEAQFQQAQKMEAIGTLAGGIAHDFNNLLTGIQGNTSLVLMHLDPHTDLYERLKGIEHHVQRGAELTRQLLGFARGGKYEVRPTDLNQLIAKDAEMFGRTKKEIDIHYTFEDAPWTVEVDRGQIAQVLLNIYVNAWQAMPDGGNLYLETRNMTMDVADYTSTRGLKPGRYVKVSITDTGIGMDEDTRQKIFEPFFTTKGVGQGTGLGLASAYGIIQNHAGMINCYSEKGVGTTFTIYLPASEKELELESHGAETLSRGSGTVLLVDDEEMVLEVGRDTLSTLGYTVTSAGSGEEAVEIYRQRGDSIDIVLLDMIMPSMGGGETFDQLKELDTEVKVLLTSGYSITGQAQEILARGCDGFIQKPCNLLELSKKIQTILAG